MDIFPPSFAFYTEVGFRCILLHGHEGRSCKSASYRQRSLARHDHDGRVHNGVSWEMGVSRHVHRLVTSLHCFASGLGILDVCLQL